MDKSFFVRCVLLIKVLCGNDVLASRLKESDVEIAKGFDILQRTMPANSNTMRILKPKSKTFFLLGVIEFIYFF